MGGHWRSTVLMNDETVGVNLVAFNGFCEELLRKSAILVLSNHPGDNVAAVEVEDDIEVEKLTSREHAEL